MRLQDNIKPAASCQVNDVRNPAIENQMNKIQTYQAQAQKGWEDKPPRVRNVSRQPINVWRVIRSERAYYLMSQKLLVLYTELTRDPGAQRRPQTVRTLPRNFSTGRAVKESVILVSSPRNTAMGCSGDLFRSIPSIGLWRQTGPDDT